MLWTYRALLAPVEVEAELSDMKAEEMAKEGFYMVKSILGHRYC